ncbi:MAG: glutamate-5-semialdehyde dehydrogenase [Candidatus Omnitrophica bacterium]|nr:glutamate-5-semialdehyde dehydrogenase [Candidatus Omnitrophota bacterium]
MNEIVLRSRAAAAKLAIIPTGTKNRALTAMAEALRGGRNRILKANELDLENARKAGRSSAFIDRLELTDKRFESMCGMLVNVASLEDPVGKVLGTVERENGLVIEKVRVPIGVIGIIYESRPNVTADCVSLCIKSGNSVILRGGSDSINSNKAIYAVLSRAAEASGLPEGAFILLEDTSRELVDAMLTATGKIDLIMPRGGENLIRTVVDKSKVPVIKHYKGVCHVYVDKAADIDMAAAICENAKIQRPGVCNAMETMLVHADIAGTFLRVIQKRLEQNSVRIKGCEKTVAILGDTVERATEKDYDTEWADLILNVRVVDSLDSAVEHISRFGSGHSDAIITEEKAAAEEFTKKVDSSAVFVNSSTRFNDGGEFGKGAEIGISTDKIHARGPMGLEELCIYKYIVRGDGQVRE